jgi:hypothetical protein
MTSDGPTRILMLQTASLRHGSLDTAEEHRQIQVAVNSAPHGKALEFDLAPSCRAEDLNNHLLRTKPSVLHFSGHCTPGAGLRFRTEDGTDAPISNQGLLSLVKEENITLALLNGCHTAELAQELAPIIGCAIGTDGTTMDGTAIAFAREFYRTIAYGLSIGQAFRRSCAAAETLGVPKEELPILYTGPETDADALFLISPRLLVPPPRESTKPDATALLARTRKQPFTVVVTVQLDAEHEAYETLINESTEHRQTQYIRSNDTNPGQRPTHGA